MTFAQCCDAYIAQHGTTWKNDKHRKQWRSTLNRACEAFGKVEVLDVSTPPPSSPSSRRSGRPRRRPARAYARRIEKVLDWATAAELRQGPNPARWKGHLEHLLARKSGGDHHTAMPWREVPAFMEQLRGEGQPVGAGAGVPHPDRRCGPSEVIGARWEEIDLKSDASGRSRPSA